MTTQGAASEHKICHPYDLSIPVFTKEHKGIFIAIAS